jgi:diaminohydroxyphosphoribosylaminopyrimidine deaminase/5-amino-6-(5-phosphoribosylamino)uracil reductase
MGLRALPDGARVHDGPGDVVQLTTRDPFHALEALWEKGIRDVWLEGGPTLAAAFLGAGLVDDVYAYVAPALLGAGRAAVADLGIRTIAGVRRLQLVDVAVVGQDVRIHAVPIEAVHTRDDAATTDPHLPERP